MKKRKLFGTLKNYLNKKEYNIIVGARQVGKTTLLKQLYDSLKEKNKNVYFLTFEDSDILKEINKHPDNLFEFVPHPSKLKEKIIVFIDEIQYAHNPSNFLKLIYDKYADKLKIVATGSSAFYLDKKFRDSLAGRKLVFKLYSLDFEEFLIFKNQKNLFDELKKIISIKEYLSINYHSLLNLLNEYLIYGGYPNVVIEEKEEEKIIKLKELKNSYLKKDILESGITENDKFYDLMSVLSGQIGNLLNKDELSNTLKITNTNIELYLYILQKSFHINLIRPYFKNLRKELTKMPKVYFNDTGLRNCFLNNFQPINLRQDKGLLLENYAYIRLRDKYEMEQIKYWRTADGNEVDFILANDMGKESAIEIKWSDVQFKKSKYKKFLQTYPDIPLMLFSFETENAKNSILKL